MKRATNILPITICAAIATLLSVGCGQQMQLVEPLGRDGAPLTVASEQIVEEYQKIDSDKRWDMVIDEKLSDYDPSEWVFDGKEGKIDVTDEGIIISAGKELYNDAHHAVLWNKRKLEGDVRIEYDYMRLDTMSCKRGNVNIIYIHAQGSGVGPYTKDIMEWNALRSIPAMKLYFNNMRTYHISYAVTRGSTEKQHFEYVRGRMYNPTNKKGLAGTDLLPEYRETGLFLPNVKYHITVTLAGERMYMEVEGDSRHELMYFDIDESTRLNDGYFGWRMMWGRSSKYANLKIYLAD